MPREFLSRSFTAVSDAGSRAVTGWKTQPGSWALSTHLALLALAIMVPLLCLAGLSLKNHIGATRQALYQDARMLADTVAANVEREMASTITLLNVLAQDTAFDRGEYAALYRRAKEVLKGRNGAVVLFGLGSKPLFHTRFPYRTPIPQLASDAIGQVAMRTGRPFVSNLFLGRVTERQFFAAIVPISRAGTVVGRLHLVLEPQDVAKDIAPAATLPRWTYSVADQDLNFVLASDPKRHKTGQAVQPDFRAQMLSDAGQFRAADASGEILLTAYRRSSLVGWTAFATIPLALVEQPLAQVWNSFALAGFASLAMSLLAAYAFSRAMARPIQHLTRAALAFGAGSDIPPVRSRLREANVLSTALSQAAEQLSGRTMALAESERRFRLLAEQMPDAIWFIDMEEKRIDYASPALERISGRSGTEIVTLEDWRNMMHPDDLATFDQGFAVERKDIVEIEYRILRPDGAVRWIRDVRFPLQIAAKKPRIVAGILRDFTPRKEALDALTAAQTEAETRLGELENLYRCAPVGLALVDTDFRVIRLNDFLAMLSEKPADDHVGQPFFEVFPNLQHQVGPLCDAVLRTGAAIQGVEFETSTPHVSEPVNMLAHFYPIQGETGPVTGIGIILESTTERKRAEQTLARLAAIVFAANDAMFSFAPTGRIQNWNPAAQSLFQYTGEEVVERSFSMLFSAESDDDYQALLNAWQSSGSLRMETQMRRKDGALIPVSISIAPIREGRNTIAISTTIEDITERRRWEKRQLLMNRELSHRVKNSLAVIQAMARHTLRSSPNPAVFTSAFEGRLRALATSHSLLTASQWEGAEIEELVREQLAPHASGSGSLHLDGPRLLIPPGMATSLGLVLHELGSNAAKFGAFSEPGGHVTLNWRVTPCEPDKKLVLEWTERGGPEVKQPARKGFGTVLIESSGKVKQHFDPEGLRYTIEMPLMEEAERQEL